jgi:hypothetical protein
VDGGGHDGRCRLGGVEVEGGHPVDRRSQEPEPLRHRHPRPVQRLLDRPQRRSGRAGRSSHGAVRGAQRAEPVVGHHHEAPVLGQAVGQAAQPGVERRRLPVARPGDQPVDDDQVPGAAAGGQPRLCVDHDDRRLLRQPAVAKGGARLVGLGDADDRRVAGHPLGDPSGAVLGDQDPSALQLLEELDP